MDDLDRQFPYPRFLKLPYIFWPDGTPEPPEWAEFKADYPGYVIFRATFVPTPQQVLEPQPQPQPEPAVSEQPQAEPWSFETPGPDARPWPGHLRQLPRATRRSGRWHTGTHEGVAAPRALPVPPPAPPPASHAEHVPDVMQLRGMDLIMSRMTPDELAWLMRTRDRYRKRHEENSERRTGGLANVETALRDGGR
jgi:hypothetical protein